MPTHPQYADIKNHKEREKFLREFYTGSAQEKAAMMKNQGPPDIDRMLQSIENHSRSRNRPRYIADNPEIKSKLQIVLIE